MTGEACRIDSALYPVSSWSSRIAACSAVSPSSMRPICHLKHDLNIVIADKKIVHLLVILGPQQLII